MQDLVLTDTEKIIIDMLAYGHNTQSILDWLGIDYAEYKKHKRQVFKKLKITRTIQVLPIALSLGLIEIKEQF